MGLLLQLIQHVRAWETPVKIGVALALIVGLLLLIAANRAPPEVRDLLLFSAALVLIVGQGLVMWGNRMMLTPYAQAQQAYIAGRVAEARDTLVQHIEALRQRGRQPNADTLTLLGNAYRQLGQLAESERMLRQAVTLQPSYYFALYGLGRTLLVEGAYAEAVPYLEQAHQRQPAAVIALDLLLAYHFSGADAAAQQLLLGQPVPDEPQRALLRALLAQRLLGQPAPDAALWAAGWAFWEAEAQQFAATPYGAGLRALAQASSLYQSSSYQSSRT